MYFFRRRLTNFFDRMAQKSGTDLTLDITPLQFFRTEGRCCGDVWWDEFLDGTDLTFSVVNLPYPFSTDRRYPRFDEFFRDTRNWFFPFPCLLSKYQNTTCKIKKIVISKVEKLVYSDFTKDLINFVQVIYGDFTKK